MNRACLFLLTTLWVSGLSAQGTVVVPEPALDAARTTLRDELLKFRDTLNTIDAAAARLQRDNRLASLAVLSSRARIMTAACANSGRNLPSARDAVRAADASDKHRSKTQGELIRAMDRLAGVLSRCEAEFAGLSKPGAGEKVRGYANARAVKVQAAIREYERFLASFFNAMGIKVRPLGTGEPVVTG